MCMGNFKPVRSLLVFSIFIISVWFPALAMDTTPAYDLDDFDTEIFSLSAGNITNEDLGEMDTASLKNYVVGKVQDFFTIHFIIANQKERYKKIFDTASSIFNKMLSSRHAILITLPNLINEIKHRVNMVLEFDEFLQLVDYNKAKDDSFKLPPCFIPRIGQLEGDKHQVPVLNGAYTDSLGCPFQAIQTCKGKQLVLDCGGATMVYSYISLSDVLGLNEFNAIFNNATFYISTFNSLLTNQSGIPISNPFFERVVTETDIKNLDELIPGDIVYFQNYPDYAKIHEDGIASGEYAIYVGMIDGEHYFRGHGIETNSYNGFVARLKKSYGAAPSDHQLGAWKKEASSMIFNCFPGICKTVYVVSYFREKAVTPWQ